MGDPQYIPIDKMAAMISSCIIVAFAHLVDNIKEQMKTPQCPKNIKSTHFWSKRHQNNHSDNKNKETENSFLKDCPILSHP